MRATKYNMWLIAGITLAFLVVQKQGFSIPFLNKGTVVDKDSSTVSL